MIYFEIKNIRNYGFKINKKKKMVETMVTIIVGRLFDSDFHKPNNPNKIDKKEKSKVETAN